MGLLRAGLRSARALAAEVGSSLRSIHRDIARLRRDGFRITGRVGRRGGFVLEPTTPVEVRLEPHEVRVLVAALLDSAVNESLLGRTDPAPLFERPMADLPPRRKRGLRALFRHVGYRRLVFSGPRHQGLLEIEEALLEGRALNLWDDLRVPAACSPKPYKVAPLGLVPGPKGWSLRFVPEPSRGRGPVDCTRAAPLASLNSALRYPGAPWWARRRPGEPWVARHRPAHLVRPFAQDV